MAQTQTAVTQRSDQASRHDRHSSVSRECSGSGARRSAPAHQRDAVARAGDRSRIASQGVQLATIQKLARYWATEYDWRKVEARLNALPQFITEIDGLDIHFIHVRSKHENALPLIVTHGWPGSIIEQLKIIDPLTNPTAHGGSASDAFHLVIPSMPGYGFSGKPTTTGWDCRPHRPRLGRADEAPRLHAIRGAGRRLGCARRRSRWACRRRRNCSASTPTCLPPFRPRSATALCPAAARRPASRRDESQAFERLAFFFTHGLAYAQQMANRPQTLYGIADSPVGLAAWFLDHDLLELRAHRTRLRRATRRPDARRHSRQHHPLLADEHGDFVGASLSGEQAALLRPDGRRHPGRRERLSRRDLPGPAELGGAGVSQADPLQQARRKAGTSRPGNSRKLFSEEVRAGFRSLRK